MPKRVVYLFGAGASHACLAAVNSAHGILMRDLGQELADRLRDTVETRFGGDRSLRALVNDVIDDKTDFEHVITFLEDSSSGLHIRFAAELRVIFESVLRERLHRVSEEQGRVPNGLYSAVLDMHDVEGNDEHLAGILTLNYDDYIERAIRDLPNCSVDLGIDVGALPNANRSIRLLKLHGSFDWAATWPVVTEGGTDTLWIPPGIEKAKSHYPFNVIWGRARELLNCDILRVIGCRLGPNDWDLIGLLFAARHTHASNGPFKVELIDSPERAMLIRQAHPYLGVHSILELDDVGPQIVAEFVGGPPRSFDGLTPEEQQKVIEAPALSTNWFQFWLEQMAESMSLKGSIATASGVFASLLNGGT